MVFHSFMALCITLFAHLDSILPFSNCTVHHINTDFTGFPAGKGSYRH